MVHSIRHRSLAEVTWRVGKYSACAAITVADMTALRWVKPKIVAEIAFVEFNTPYASKRVIGVAP